MNQDDELRQRLKRCPRYVQVAFELSEYLIDQKDLTPRKDRTGRYALISLELQGACRRFKCSKKTLLKAILILEDMDLAYPLYPHQ